MSIIKIGVFDSGIGGKSIANHLENDYPSAEVQYVDDRKNVPYGTKRHDKIVELVDTAIQPLLEATCDVIVLACNTATAAAIDILREKYPGTLFVGLEPMIKTASSLTNTGIVGVCATPYTLSSARYNLLKTAYADGIKVIEPDCSQWASMIEYNTIDDLSIQQTVDDMCDQGADVIVLACTHYHWIKSRITEIARGRAAIIDPSDAISRRVQQLLPEITV